MRNQQRLRHGMPQRVPTYATVVALYPPVPADSHADIVPSFPACCVVGHDQRSHAAAHAVKQTADGRNEGKFDKGGGLRPIATIFIALEFCDPCNSVLCTRRFCH